MKRPSKFYSNESTTYKKLATGATVASALFMMGGQANGENAGGFHQLEAIDNKFTTPEGDTIYSAPGYRIKGMTSFFNDNIQCIAAADPADDRQTQVICNNGPKPDYGVDANDIPMRDVNKIDFENGQTLYLLQVGVNQGWVYESDGNRESIFSGLRHLTEVQQEDGDKLALSVERTNFENSTQSITLLYIGLGSNGLDYPENPYITLNVPNEANLSNNASLGYGITVIDDELVIPIQDGTEMSMLRYRYDGNTGFNYSSRVDFDVPGLESISAPIIFDSNTGEWGSFMEYNGETGFYVFTLPEFAPTDTDGDGISDIDDNCSDVPNTDQADTDQDGIGDVCDSEDNRDNDGDGVEDFADNCPETLNPDQADSDNNGIGDACEDLDIDTDGDSVPDIRDNCPEDTNRFQTDTDGDGLGDACDNCPETLNSDQADADQNGVGDVCEDTGSETCDPEDVNIRLNQEKRIGAGCTTTELCPDGVTYMTGELEANMNNCTAPTPDTDCDQVCESICTDPNPSSCPESDAGTETGPGEDTGVVTPDGGSDVSVEPDAPEDETPEGDAGVKPDVVEDETGVQPTNEEKKDGGCTIASPAHSNQSIDGILGGVGLGLAGIGIGVHLGRRRREEEETA